MPSILERQLLYWFVTAWTKSLNPSLWTVKPRYAIWQLEEGFQREGPTEGKHYQLYVCFKNPVRGAQLSKMIGRKPHLEPRRGTHSEAKTYCSKTETRIAGPWEYGSDTDIPEVQGQRSDLKRCKKLLDDGKSMKVVAQEEFSCFIRYHKGLYLYRLLTSPKRNWEMQCITFIGGTGIGKTRSAYEIDPNLYSVPSEKQSGCYWDGYDGQETVLVDEMSSSRFNHAFLLRLTDRYPFKVPIHNGQVEFLAKVIIFTSKKHPRFWYDKNKFPWNDGQLCRRLLSNNGKITQLQWAI